MPPPTIAELPLSVLLVTFNVPTLLIPPPPPKTKPLLLLELPLSVLLVTFNVPEVLLLEMPPPTPPLVVWLPLIVQLVTFTVPEPELLIPPPLLPAATPLLMVRPKKVTMPVAVTLKTRTLTPVPGRTVSLSAPGPSISVFTAMSGSACVRLIVQTPAEQNGSDAGIAKMMVLGPFAESAPRSEQPAVPLKHALATTVSDVVLTV